MSLTSSPFVMPAPTNRVGSSVNSADPPDPRRAVTFAHAPSTMGVLSGPMPVLLQSNGRTAVTDPSTRETLGPEYGSGPPGTSDGQSRTIPSAVATATRA